MAEIKVTAFAGSSTKTEIIAGKHKVSIDEPPFFGGKDEAPSPVAMFLASLAGCINAIGQWVAKEMDIQIHSLKMEISGDVDSACFCQDAKEVRAGFSAIRVSLELDSDADGRQVEVWKAAVLRRCPVCDNICHPAEFALDVKRVESERCLCPENTRQD